MSRTVKLRCESCGLTLEVKEIPEKPKFCGKCHVPFLVDVVVSKDPEPGLDPDDVEDEIYIRYGLDEHDFGAVLARIATELVRIRVVLEGREK